MVRKVFWVLWMTVWPIAALAPHFVPAHAARDTVADEHAATAPTATAEVPVANDPPARPSLAQIASAKDTRIPLLAAAELGDVPPPSDPVMELPAPATESSPKLEVDEIDEGNGDSPSILTTTESPATDESYSAIPAAEKPTRTTRRIVPCLTAQEERAQRLIHERAAMQGLQRYARLEVKYRRASGAHPNVPLTRWQPHLVETNWNAARRRAGNP